MDTQELEQITRIGHLNKRVKHHFAEMCVAAEELIREMDGTLLEIANPNFQYWNDNIQRIVITQVED